MFKQSQVRCFRYGNKLKYSNLFRGNGIKMSSIIEVWDLAKAYRTSRGKHKRIIEALKGIDLQIEKGEFFGLLGPNGAGKTTFIQCLTTLLLPTRGGGIVCGYDILREPQKVRASIGCMLTGERSIYWKLTGRENLDYFGALYYMPSSQRRSRIEELKDMLDMKEFLDRRVETYSSGQKMKVAFAKALIADPPVLILDEPTITLDVHASRELRAITKGINRNGTTVLYTTHLMFEAEELCDRVAIMDDGVIKSLGTVDELKDTMGSGEDRIIRIEVPIVPDSALPRIEELEGITRCIVKSAMDNGGERELLLTCRRPRDVLPAAIKILADSGAAIKAVEVEPITLETVFIRLTGRTLEESTREGA